MKRIESAFEKIKAADKIQEDPWQEVVLRELNEISKDYSKELQTETGQIGNKGSDNRVIQLLLRWLHAYPMVPVIC